MNEKAPTLGRSQAASINPDSIDIAKVKVVSLGVVGTRLQTAVAAVRSPLPYLVAFSATAYIVVNDLPTTAAAYGWTGVCVTLYTLTLGLLDGFLRVWRVTMAIYHSTAGAVKRLRRPLKRASRWIEDVFAEKSRP